MNDPTPDPEPTGGVTVYWRPGCPFCMHLDRGLAKFGIETERRNIWDDPDAAATVRKLANGNETVPTVTVGGWFMVNPSAKEVLAAMRRETPHLVPDDLAEESESRSGPIETTIRRILGN